MKRIIVCGIVLGVVGLASPALGASVTLANGDTLKGEVVEETDTEVVINHPQLGTLRIAQDQIQKESPPNPGLFGTDFMLGWRRRFDLGFNGEEGNSDTKTVTSGLALDYLDDTKRWDVKGRYFYNKGDDDDDNNARLSVRRDFYFKDTKWFAGLGTEYKFDEFEAWRHRLVLFGGPAYHLIDTEKHKLDIMAGPAYTREFKGDNQDKLEGVVNFRFLWNISEDHILTLNENVFTELEPDGGGVRNLAIANWAISLSKEYRLTLNIGVESEWESRPSGSDEKHDLKYFLTLGVGL